MFLIFDFKDEQTLEKAFIEAIDNEQRTFQSCKSLQGPQLGTHSDPMGKILWLVRSGEGSTNVYGNVGREFEME